MLLFLIFSIFTFFFILIQEQSKETAFTLNFQQDQLKSLAGFLRTHENYDKIDQEKDLGISESFFIMKIKLIKNANCAPENCIPFDSPYLIYPNLFNKNSNSEAKSFLDSSNEVFLNGNLVSKYEIQYYSNFLKHEPSDITKKSNFLIYQPFKITNQSTVLPNTESIIFI